VCSGRGILSLFALPDDDRGCRKQDVGFVQQWLDVQCQRDRLPAIVGAVSTDRLAIRSA
jgi:hypothetical protein